MKLIHCYILATVGRQLNLSPYDYVVKKVSKKVLIHSGKAYKYNICLIEFRRYRVSVSELASGNYIIGESSTNLYYHLSIKDK